MTALQQTLLRLQDIPYRDFLRKLIPNVAPERIIGVRTPELRKLAKQIPDPEAFLRALPHRYFEEDQLHSFYLSAGKDFSKVAAAVDVFLPHVDNWAVCDQMNPRVFAENRERLLPYIRRWLSSEHVYTVRFGIVMLMKHYLEEDFSPAYSALVARISHPDYYVRMAVAWYFAEALAKQFDAASPYLAEKKLDQWTHNKAIQKARESYRISPEQKALLLTLRR